MGKFIYRSLVLLFAITFLLFGCGGGGGGGEVSDNPSEQPPDPECHLPGLTVSIPEDGKEIAVSDACGNTVKLIEAGDLAPDGIFIQAEIADVTKDGRKEVVAIQRASTNRSWLEVYGIEYDYYERYQLYGDIYTFTIYQPHDMFKQLIICGGTEKVDGPGEGVYYPEPKYTPVVFVLPGDFQYGDVPEWYQRLDAIDPDALGAGAIGKLTLHQPMGDHVIQAEEVYKIDLTRPNLPYTTTGKKYCLSLMRLDEVDCRILNVPDPTENPTFLDDLSMVDSVDLGNIYSTPAGFQIQGRYAYVLQSESVSDTYLKVIEIDPPNSTIISTTTLSPDSSFFHKIAIKDNYILIGGPLSSLFVYDISVPSNPSFVTKWEDISGVDNILVSGNYAYIIKGSQFSILDISDIQNPVVLKSIEIQGLSRTKMVKNRDHVYIAAYGLYAVDVSNPYDPTSFQIYDFETSDYHMDTAGYYLYHNYKGNLSIENIYYPETSFWASISYDLLEPEAMITAYWPYVFSSGSSLKIIDVSDRLRPVVAQEIASVSSNSEYRQIDFDGTYVYGISKYKYASSGAGKFVVFGP